MPRCCCETEDIVIRESFAPCPCKGKEIEVSRKISRLHHPHRGHPGLYLPDLISGYGDRCLCYECRKVRGLSEAYVHKKERGKKSNYKRLVQETVLERERSCNCCDRLSFPEFVRMWQCADWDGCGCCSGCHHGLSPVIKKYKVFPDSRHCNCHGHHCKPLTLATECLIQDGKCSCGEMDKVVHYVKQEEKKEATKEKPKKIKDKIEPKSSDDLPTMSMNRDDLV